jgi:hypothetical protein
MFRLIVGILYSVFGFIMLKRFTNLDVAISVGMMVSGFGFMAEGCTIHRIEKATKK